jgi:hypothetical protein
MIRTVRAYFLARHLREKILLVAFALLIAAWWFSDVAARGGHFLRAERSTTLALTQQASWLAQQNSVETQATSAASRLDPTQTLDSTRLLSELERIAGDANLKNNQFLVGNATNESSGQFTIYTLLFNIQKSDWSTIKTFYLELQARSPYIGIEQFSLQRDNGNPALLNASIKVSSVEITRG